MLAVSICRAIEGGGMKVVFSARWASLVAVVFSAVGAVLCSLPAA
jgi:hypothetical protein